MERVVEEEKDSTFIWDMSLEEKQEVLLGLDFSFQDPYYLEPEESFMSQGRRGLWLIVSEAGTREKNKQETIWKVPNFTSFLNYS